MPPGWRLGYTSEWGFDCISLSETERHGPSEEEGWLLLARMLGACTSNGERIKQLTSWCICDKEGGKERALSSRPLSLYARGSQVGKTTPQIIMSSERRDISAIITDSHFQCTSCWFHVPVALYLLLFSRLTCTDHPVPGSRSPKDQP